MISILEILNEAAASRKWHGIPSNGFSDIAFNKESYHTILYKTFKLKTKFGLYINKLKLETWKVNACLIAQNTYCGDTSKSIKATIDLNDPNSIDQFLHVLDTIDEQRTDLLKQIYNKWKEDKDLEKKRRRQLRGSKRDRRAR